MREMFLYNQAGPEHQRNLLNLRELNLTDKSSSFSKCYVKCFSSNINSRTNFRESALTYTNLHQPKLLEMMRKVLSME